MQTYRKALRLLVFCVLMVLLCIALDQRFMTGVVLAATFGLTELYITYSMITWYHSPASNGGGQLAPTLLGLLFALTPLIVLQVLTVHLFCLS